MKLLLMSLLLLPSLAFSMSGLKVGDSVPSLKLKTTAGQIVDMSDLEQTSVLVFYRGAWCPYCLKQLKDVEKELMSAKPAAVNVYAISVDRDVVAKKMKDKNKFSFEVVSDPKALSLKAFNIVNKLDDKLVKKYKSSYSIDVEADSGEKHHMVAHPGVFIVKSGKIIFADVHTNYKERTSNKDILNALK